MLGSGPYSIGSSVEFDWCAVNSVQAFAQDGFQTVVINSNPETVSTDFDNCDKLYFDELSLERVLDIIEIEQPDGVVLFAGGQVSNNLAAKLAQENVRIFGTSAEQIERAENREKFSQILDRLEIDQPQWRAFSKIERARSFAEKVGFPVLIRPSKVLSGAAMAVAKNEIELENFLSRAAKIDSDAPVVISKFETGAREIEMDAVAHKGEVVIWAISEHVENAGVHSGDATIVLPPQKTWLETVRRVKKITKQIAREIEITGPFNIQFLAKKNQIKVIELNLRASRSFPFVSKATGHNFVQIAAQAALGKVQPKSWRKKNYQTLDLDHVCVKVPQFSFSRLKNADPVLSVEMASTGEVACFGDDFHEAFLKAMIATGFKMPAQNICLSIGGLENKVEFLPSAKLLEQMGFALFATGGTAKFFQENGFQVEILHKVSASRTPNIADFILQKKLDLVICIPKNFAHEEITDGFKIRRGAIDANIPLIINLQVAKVLVDSLHKFSRQKDPFSIKSWCEFF